MGNHEQPRPTNVKIGPFLYRITYKDDMDPYRHLVGLSDHCALEIWIKVGDGTAPSKEREIVIHEIVHCIMFIYGGTTECDDDDWILVETAAMALGMGLLQVLHDNPELVNWLMYEPTG